MLQTAARRVPGTIRRQGKPDLTVQLRTEAEQEQLSRPGFLEELAFERGLDGKAHVRHQGLLPSPVRS